MVTGSTGFFLYALAHCSPCVFI